MPLSAQLEKCVIGDNSDEFNILIAQADSDSHRDALIIALLCNMAAFQSISILNVALSYPAVLANIITNPSIRKTLFIVAARHGSLPFVTRLLDIPAIRDYVIANPYEAIVAAAEGGHSDSVLNKIMEVLAIGDCISAWNNQAYICARVYCNKAASNRLLEFPDIFEYVDSCYEKQSTGDCILRFLEHYFPALDRRIAEFQRINHEQSFDLNYNEAKLCFLILRNLIRTYSERDELRSFVAIITEIEANRTDRTLLTKARTSITHFRERFIPTRENVHLNRILQLLSFPAVQKIAANNNNELLRMAIGLGGRDELVTQLRSITTVSEYETMHPVDAEYERTHPIDFEQQYKLTHPSPAVIAYELKHPKP